MVTKHIHGRPGLEWSNLALESILLTTVMCGLSVDNRDVNTHMHIQFLEHP